MTHAAIYVRMSTEGRQAMKRDLNLVRQILLDLERSKTTDEGGWPKLDLPGRTEAEIGYHVRLMHADGLIDAHNVTTHDRPPGQEAWKATALTWKATSLTSKGHEFLEMARDESVWGAVLAKVGGASAASRSQSWRDPSVSSRTRSWAFRDDGEASKGPKYRTLPTMGLALVGRAGLEPATSAV